MSITSMCTSRAIKDGAGRLIEGDLVAFPTETVYGLGADATNNSAVNKIYKVKGRPTDHPLIVHISSLKNLDLWANDVPEYAIRLARAFWPGPMTLILSRTDLAKDFITGGQAKVGIRIPSHTIAFELLTEFEKLGGKGVAAPSANRFRAVSPTSANAVESELGEYLSKNDLILDGGACEVGVESTIIDCTTALPIILRPGAITHSMITQITSLVPEVNNTNGTKASGLLESHYSPKARVLLDKIPEPGDGLIALNEVITPEGVIRLASPKNNEEYAKLLYKALHDGDTQQLQIICAQLPTGGGIAIAIRDRLKKASNLN